MDRRRLLILLVLVVGLALIGGLAAFLVLGNGLEQLGLVPTQTPTPPPPTIAVEPGQPTPASTVAPEQEFVEVVVSQQTVPRGFQMTEAELRTEFRLADDVRANVITNIDDALGLFARKDIYQGETLTIDALVPDLKAIGREDAGPSSLIPPGFVAMAVPMDRMASVAYALETGDSIDILVSFYLQQVDEQFQTLLPNNATFTFLNEETTVAGEGEEATETSEPTLSLYTISPQGRFEQLPNGDVANIAPSTPPRGVHVAFVIQNAKVIEVGHFIPSVPPLLPTPTPDPESEEAIEGEEEEQTVSEVAQLLNQATSLLTGPPYNQTILLALPPQQQVFLKYAVETESIIDYALRGENDGELYPVENVDLTYVLERFNVEIPPNFTYIVGTDSGYFEGFKDDEAILNSLNETESNLQSESNAEDGQSGSEEGQ